MVKKRQPDRTVLDKGGVCKSFNAAAHKGEPAPRSFEACLESHFGPETTQEVLDIFARLELPVPEDPVQYLDGMEGPLVFVNRYGVVARVEHPQSMHSVQKGEDLPDNPWNVPTLGRITVGEGTGRATVKICAGWHFETEEKTLLVDEKLKGLGLTLRDKGMRNLGRMPKFRSEKWPEGVTGVIDPLAVGKMSADELTRAVGPVRRALLAAGFMAERKARKEREFREEVREIMQAREDMYGPLSERFRQCWEGKRPMRDFWNMCEDRVRDGTLVAGWNEFRTSGYRAVEEKFEKTAKAKETAFHYERMLAGREAAMMGGARPEVSSGAPATRV